MRAGPLLVTAAILAVSCFLAAARPDLLLFLLAGSALLLAGLFAFVGLGRTLEWVARLVRR